MEKCKIGVAVMLWVFLLVAGAAYGFTPVQYVTDPCTVALYHFNEGSGTVVTDSGGLGHNGVLIGSPKPSWVPGAFYTGLHLAYSYNDPTATQIQLPSGMLAYNATTVEMQLKWDYATAGPDPGESDFLGYLYSDGQEFCRAFIDSSNPYHWGCMLQFGVETYSSGGDPMWFTVQTPAGQGITDLAWTDVAFTRSWGGYLSQGGTGLETDTIYINGVAVATGINHGCPGGGAGGNLVFGSTGDCWGGNIDEIRISNVARTSFGAGSGGGGGSFELGDINQDYKVDFKDFALLAKGWMTCTDPTLPNCTNCGSYVPYTADANTLLLWHMNEGTGTVAYDATANHYDLTLNAGGGAGFSWYPLSIFGYGLQTTLSNTSYCATTKGLPLLNLNGTGLGTNQLSMSAWVQITGSSTDGAYIVDINNSAFIRVSTDGTDIDAGFYTWSNHGTWVVASASPLGNGALLKDGNWHNVSAVYNGIADAGGNANVYLYWDGVKVATASVAANTDIETGHGNRIGLTLVDTQDGTVRIGSPIFNVTQAYKGFIDEVMISNVARSKFMFGACE